VILPCYATGGDFTGGHDFRLGRALTLNCETQEVIDDEEPPACYGMKTLAVEAHLSYGKMSNGIE
jgi:hypothetical protein